MYHFLQKLISSLRPSSTNANLLQRVPLSFFYLFYVTYKTGRLQRDPPFNFFWHCANFFSKIFNISKECPLRIFWYFATESMLMNPKGSPLFIFWHYATFSKFFFKKKFFKKIFKKIFKLFFCFQSRKVIFQSYRAWKAHFGCLESVFKAFHEHILGKFRKLSFLSLRYSADFRRSRLVLYSFVTNWRGPFFHLFVLKCSWSQNMFSLIQFPSSVVTECSVPFTAGRFIFWILP